MADWEHIECGFDGADETLNFGTRNVAGVDNLHEACTLALIRTTEGSHHKPNVKAVIKCGYIFFSIDKTMKVFSDTLCTDLTFNITFDDKIDVFCITRDAKYLLLCLQTGMIHCFEMENGALIYTDNILENGDPNEPSFIDAFLEYDADTPSFLLVSKNGKVFRITTSNMSADGVKLESPLLEFNHELFADLNTEILSAVFLDPLLMVVTGQVCLYNVKTMEMDCNEIGQFKRILPHNRMFLGLDMDGHLVNICTKTLLSFPVKQDEVFEDVLLVGDADTWHILAVTKVNEVGISNLQMLTYPDYSPIFSLQMTTKIHLMKPENTNEEVIFISEMKHGDNVNELRFQVVSETSPEDRLNRLLRKQKFEEAEQCAKLFQLDLSEIQKAKAQVIVDKSECDESDIDRLLHILETIEDDDFKIESCLKIHVCCNSLKDIERVLSYGYLLSANCEKKFYTESCEVISQLKIRFDTFKTLVRCIDKKYTVQEWQDFSDCDLIEELYEMLKRNSIDESIIIYTRLDALTISKLTEAHVSKILDALNNVTIQERLPFLMNFLPLTLTHLPSSKDLFTDWITGVVFQTEKNHPRDFPENAITFMKKIVQTLKVDSLNINFRQQCWVDQKSSSKLTLLLDALEQLRMLKKNYNIGIPLQQFLQPKEILMETVLLSQVIDIVANKKLVEELIDKFIRNYQLEPDVILMNVIKNIVTYVEECWVNVVPVIINLIGSINLKLEATLIVVKAAGVPWCQTIRDIADKSMEYSHPLVKEIRHEIQYEPKRVIFNKYHPVLTNRHINSINDLKHAMERIIYCNQPSMIEDLYGVCINSKEKHEANMLLIYHYLKTSELLKVLEVLNNNEQTEMHKCCRQLEIFVSVTMQEKGKPTKLEENCCEILNLISKKLQTESYSTERLNILQGVHKIKQHFSLPIVPENLENPQNKHKLFKNLLQLTVEELQETNDLVKYNENCDKISAYLNVNKITVLLKVCEQIDDFNVILQAAEDIYSSDCDVSSLCNIVGLILKNLGAPENFFVNFGDESFLQNPIDVNVFVTGLKLSQKLIVKAMLNANVNEIWNCFELANWVQTTYCITQDYTKCSSKFLGDCYKGDLILPSISTFNGIRHFFLMSRKITDPLPKSSRCVLEYVNNSTEKLEEEQVTAEMQRLQSTVACLSTEGHSITAYKLLRRLLNTTISADSNISANIITQLSHLIDKCTKQLLQSIFAAPEIDADLAYSLLLSCDLKYSDSFLFQSLKTYKRIPQKFKTVCYVYLRFLKHHKKEEHQRLCRNLIYLFKWWDKINACPVPYHKFFSTQSSEVLKKLITFNCFNIEMVTEFCADLKLDANFYYEYYLKNLLLNWKADYTIKTNTEGKQVLFVKNNEEQFEEDCMEVIEVIGNKETVCDLLNRMWNSINYYHYEVFVCVSNILSMLQPGHNKNEGILVLKFLQNYIRTCAPGSAEEEQWFTLYPETQQLDPLAKWRLPFTPTLFTNKIWSIIRPEINLKTYSLWFPMISALKYLNKNDICSYAIKDIPASGVFAEITEEWVLRAKHNHLLAEIEECVQNMSNLEQATSVLYYITTNIPGGADQVNAITLCYKYAQEYLKQFPQADDVLKAVIKVKSKYFGFSTAHILHRNQLANQQYLAMITGPVEELIEALYMDNRIVEQANSPILHCPDINKTVNELAELHSIDIQVKRKEFLLSWLTTIGMDASVSKAGDVNYHAHDPSVNLIRASYLCTSGNIAMWQDLLLQLGNINPETESRNLNNKTNKAIALQCFCNISDIETIEKLTGTSYDEFLNLIDKLTLINSLECFGIMLNIESLGQYNKKDLLNRLAYNLTTPTGINTMALLCTTYKIYEFKYWSAVITGMMKLNMVRELKKCVNILKPCVTFYNKKLYIDAWQAVINNCFNFASKVTKEDLMNLLKENFYLIQTCPVIDALDLEYVIKRCMQMGKYNFASLAVCYVKGDRQTFFLKEILKNKQNVIYEEIDQLSVEGFCGTKSIKILLENQQRKSSS